MVPDEVRNRIAHHIHTQTLDPARDVVRDRNRLAEQLEQLRIQIGQVYQPIELQTKSTP